MRPHEKDGLEAFEESRETRPRHGADGRMRRRIIMKKASKKSTSKQAKVARKGKTKAAKPQATPEKPVAKTAEPKSRKKAVRQDGTMSGLDAAAKVLAEAGEPLNCKTIVERSIERGLWKTTGKTPQATVYAAIIREIAKKGETARFAKTERGMFTIKA